MRWTVIFLATLAISPLAAAQIQLDQSGLRLAQKKASLRLRPSIKANGRWYRCDHLDPVRRDARQGRPQLSYQIPELGEVTVTRLGDSTLKMGFSAHRAVNVQALALEGEATLPGARAWLSNGAQSWSQSGVIRLGARPQQKQLDSALRATGWGEEYRKGRELSWEYTYVGGGRRALVAGALSANRFRPWLQVSRSGPGKVGIRMVSGGAGESVFVGAGKRLKGERWHVELGRSRRLPKMLEAYAAQLSSRPVKHRRGPTVAWNSWYQLYTRVTEAAVRQNARHLKEAAVGIEGVTPSVVIDDGWEKDWGDWTGNRKKFPRGVARVAKDLKAEGISPGIWLAPFLASVKAPVVREHPEWFVQDHVFRHGGRRYRVLDVTHPGAAKKLERTVRGLVGVGFETLKIDFLATGSAEGKRHQQVTGMQAYHRGMQIIRKAAGPGTRLIASGAPGVATFGYVDAWRVAADVAWPVPSAATGPTWPEVVSLARNLGARWFLHRAVGLDTDPMLLRGWRDPAKLHAATSLPGLAGHGIQLSDDLTRLSPERLRQGLRPKVVDMAMSGKASRPARLIPRQVPSDLGAGASTLQRILGIHRVSAPEAWLTPGGSRVRLDLSSN